MRAADLNSFVKFATELIDSLIRPRPFFPEYRSNFENCLRSVWGECQNLRPRILISSLPYFVCVCVRDGSPRITYTNFSEWKKPFSWFSSRESGRLVDVRD